jgi:hypothetical protein
MRLFRYLNRGGYGKDYHLNLIEIGGWCLIQSCFTIGVFGRYFPYLNITMGSGRLLGISVQVWRFGIVIEFLSRSWFK